jgi:dephospho-CoA kinase
MSGVGKSTVVSRLASLGFKAVDLDEPPYADGPEWNVPEVARLLDREDASALFVAGTSERQIALYPRFDEIVLLSLPDDVMRERIERRANNPYGKDPADVSRQLSLKTWVEPALRRAATLEIDSRTPLEEVVSRIAELVQ